MKPDMSADYSELIKMSLEAREMAYSPYSKFSVGAALLAGSGNIYTGSNIENSSYPATCCAERTAFFIAINSGEKTFSAIAVSGGKSGSDPEEYCPPCGICRQVMSEFCSGDFKILLVKNTQDYKLKTLSELLPMSFSNANLE